MERVVAHFDSNDLKKDLEYYKRDELEVEGFRRRFWFRNKHLDFHIDLYGEELYEFLGKHEIGDVFDFSGEED